MREATRQAKPFQAPAKCDVLHQRNVGETTDGREPLAAHENRLVAGGDSRQAGAPIHQAFDHAQGRLPAGEANVESTPTRVRKPIDNEARGLQRQACVRMQEEKNLTVRGAYSRVHLARPSTRRGHHAVGAGPREGRCAVLAAAVHNNDLASLRAKRLQRGQRRAERFTLVQHRDHDR